MMKFLKVAISSGYTISHREDMLGKAMELLHSVKPRKQKEIYASKIEEARLAIENAKADLLEKEEDFRAENAQYAKSVIVNITKTGVNMEYPSIMGMFTLLHNTLVAAGIETSACHANTGSCYLVASGKKIRISDHAAYCAGCQYDYCLLKDGKGWSVADNFNGAPCEQYGDAKWFRNVTEAIDYIVEKI